MIKKILYITLFSLLTFTFNVNSAEIKCDSVVISSPEIKGDEDCKKKKISTKNAEVKFDDGSIYQGPIKKNKMAKNTVGVHIRYSGEGWENQLSESNCNWSDEDHITLVKSRNQSKPECFIRKIY